MTSAKGGTGRIRVLQVIGSSAMGGGEKIVSSLLKYLDKDRFEVYIACPAGGPLFDEFKKYAAEIKIVGFNHWFFNFRSIFLLKRYMLDKRIDIVHTHLYAADYIGLIAAMCAKVPRKVTTIHGYNFFLPDRFNLRYLKNFLCSRVYRLVYMLTDALISISDAVRQDLIGRRGFKVSGKEIKTIYGGIDSDDFARKAFRVSYDRGINEAHAGGRIGMVANFDRVKGHHVLLKAAAKVIKESAQAEFIFIGDGEERHKSELTAGRLKIEKNVLFKGMLKNPGPEMARCDLIVVPSLTEGFSLVALEAMALSKPVVVTNAGGLPEVVEDRVTGLIVPPKDPERLAESILYLLDHKDIAARMGLSGHERLKSLFKVERMIGETEELYRGLLSENGKHD